MPEQAWGLQLPLLTQGRHHLLTLEHHLLSRLHELLIQFLLQCLFLFDFAPHEAGEHAHTIDQQAAVGRVRDLGLHAGRVSRSLRPLVMRACSDSGRRVFVQRSSVVLSGNGVQYSRQNQCRIRFWST